MDISDILDSYGALKSILSIPMRKSATLEILLTDLHTLFHPPTTLSPLQVDRGKVGKDSDHNIVVFAPKNNIQFQQTRSKKTIMSRPLPESGLLNFEKELIRYPWDEVLSGKSVNEQVEEFHYFLRSQLDKFFPEKMVKMSNLDKKWFSPQLKQIHRTMQREFYKHRRSEKYKRLKSKFKRLKRRSIQTFYSTFVSDLKTSNSGKWYTMAKKIGAIDQMSNGEIKVECLSNYNNKQCAEKIAKHFASISNEYDPVDLT